jgi:predicted DNA-binding WGR domain protein
VRITDLEPYNDYEAPLYRRYLEYVGVNYKNKSGKSDKFWEVAVFKRDSAYVVVRRWGKYGKKGQVKEGRCWSKHAAKRKARELKHKKREEGYTKEIDVITRLGMKGAEDAA